MGFSRAVLGTDATLAGRLAGPDPAGAAAEALGVDCTRRDDSQGYVRYAPAPEKPLPRLRWAAVRAAAAAAAAAVMRGTRVVRPWPPARSTTAMVVPVGAQRAT